MTHPLLAENEAKRLNIRLPLLICFAMFNAWQMGMVYFSGQTMSIDGRTPLPVNIDDVTIHIVSGYILSILVMIFLPGTIVWMERIAAFIALFAALVLYLPLPPEILVFALYLQFFCCCFMIGFETAIIVGLFTEKTAIIFLTMGYGITIIPAALLQNDFIKFPYSIFRIFTVFALVLMLIFFLYLPAKAWPRCVKKADGLTAPKSVFAGVFLWTGLSCLVCLFGIAAAENVKHGVFVFYLSSSICGFIIFLLWKFFDISVFRSIYVIIALGVMGFVMSLASFYLPALSITACVLLGAGYVSLWFNPFFGNILFSRHYPSKFISPLIIGTAFVAVLIHSRLLDILRNNTILLHVTYLVITVGMALLYFLLEPYLLYSFRNRPLFENSKPEADEQLKDIDEQTEENADLQSVNKQIDDLSKKLKASTLDDLSYQELRIAELSLKGHTYAEIATALNIKLNTVRWYMKNIYTKLQINSKAELFHLAFKREERNIP